MDIDKVFKSKNSKVYKFLPGFLISYLKRIIHEDDLNRFLEENLETYGLDFAEKVLFGEFGAKTVSVGLEHVQPTGRYIVASNHPLGGPDGMALMLTIAKVRKDLIFPVNDILMNVPNTKELFIPINKHGSNTENIRIINETFASNSVIGFFPAGLVSRKKSGKIADLEWKQTFITKAKRFKRDIIPTHIDGRNSNFFYNLANLRVKLRIKTNIEMLYLVNEMYKQRDKTIKITFGKPIPYQTFDKRMKNLEWAQKIREHVYNIETDPNCEFNY